MKFLSTLLCTLLFAALPSAHALDFDQYKTGDLDQLLAMPKVKSGVKMVVPQKLHFRAVFAAPLQNCNTDILKKTMVMQGTKKEIVDKMALSKCLPLKSAKGGVASVYLEDKVADRLAREAKPGEIIDVFCEFLFIGPAGPALLGHEYKRIK